jgi:dihydrofolate synthase/folylpolyglutamate synthase
LPLTADPLAFLFSLERLGMKFGLENMQKLCAELGHPERRFRSVVVAGTNGKGSVTAMVETALHLAGYRSARYTSPHLERVEERFLIGQREVDTPTLAGAASRVQQAVERMLHDRILDTPPTFFECATAIAFELFAAAGVDIAVLEVGLGGRLDATNVVNPIAVAITSIDFDHEALLGNTLASIAREKAGIIRSGIPVACGPLPDEARRVVEDVCQELGARFTPADAIAANVSVGPEGTIADFATEGRRVTDVRLALRGRHQVTNGAVAFALLDALGSTGLCVGDAAIRGGLEGTLWPGRLELTTWGNVRVLLDSAHNPAGARALSDYLCDAGWSDATLVFGVLADKDARRMLAALAPRFKRIVFTTAPSPRALAAAEAAAMLPGPPDAGPAVEIEPDPAAALRRAAAIAPRVVVAGSIFLIGALRGILR